MKMKPIKHPSMMSSSIIKPKRYDDQDEAAMLAKGGEVSKAAEEDKAPMMSPLEGEQDEMAPSKQEIMAKHMEMLAEGGIVDEQEIEEASSLAAAIMAKRKAKKMAEGGMVDLDENAEEEPNSLYHLNEDAALKENDDSDMDSMEDPMDSNEHADSREEDAENDHDRSVVGSIRAKMKKRSPLVK